MDSPNGNDAQHLLSLTRSPSIVKLAASLVKAQAQIKSAAKDSKNPHYDSRYAGLASIDDACRPALNGAGIAVIQSPSPAEAGRLGLTTILLHESGEFLAGAGEIPVQGNGPQAYGSAMTYARRYFLAAMTGVCPDDDDANSAEGKAQPQQRAAPPRPPARTPPPAQTKPEAKATPEAVQELTDLVRDNAIPALTVAKWLTAAGVDEFDKMSARAVQGCIGWINAQKRKTKPAAA